MVRHILRKDFRLLWPLAIAVGVVPFALVGVDLRHGHFGFEDSTLESLSLLLQIVFYVGAGCLIATLIHQDSLVGVKQDWLVRPIRRRDLLLAKLIFVMAVVQLPLLIAMTAEGLIDGFALRHALVPALTENLWLLAAFTFPVLAVASLTKTMTEAVGVAVAVMVAFLCCVLLMRSVGGVSSLGPTSSSDISWIPQTEWLLIYFVGSIAILTLQYFRRRTRAAWIVLALGLPTGIVVAMMTPWKVAFGWQSALSPSPAAANSIAISFDAPLGPFRPVTNGSTHIQGVAVAREANDPALYVPLRFDGIPQHSMLRIDNAAVYIEMPGTKGRVLLSESDHAQEFEVPDDPFTIRAARTQYERITAQPQVYARAKDLPVTLEIEYSATLLNLASVDELPTRGGDRRLAIMGWCETRLNASQTQVDLRCIDAGNTYQCASAFLENPATGQRNPDIHGCQDGYTPWLGRYKPLNSMTHGGAVLRFRDPSGLIHYPVDPTQVAASVVVIRAYEPVARFTRRIAIQGIRLSDWAGQ